MLRRELFLEQRAARTHSPPPTRSLTEGHQMGGQQTDVGRRTRRTWRCSSRPCSKVGLSYANGLRTMIPGSSVCYLQGRALTIQHRGANVGSDSNYKLSWSNGSCPPSSRST